MKTVQELYTEIQNIHNEIAEIQTNCSHPDFTVRMYSWRVGAYVPARICNVCQHNLKEITQEESDKCWLEWNRNFKQTTMTVGEQ